MNKYLSANLFYKENRREVLALYRLLYKAIPRVSTNYVMRISIEEELKFFFRNYREERTPVQINELKMVAYQVLAKIEAGVYPPFPTILKRYHGK